MFAHPYQADVHVPGGTDDEQAGDGAKSNHGIRGW